MTSMCDSRGEHVHVRPGRAPGADAEAMGVHPRASPAAEDPPAGVGDVVEELRRALAREVDVVVPERDLPLAVHGRDDLHDAGRIERVVEELLGAGQGHLHRPPGDLREPRRLHGLAAGALPAEAAADVGGDHAHVLRVEATEPARADPASGRASGSRPRPSPAALELGRRRVRLDRRVRDVALVVGALEQCAPRRRAPPRRRPSDPSPPAPAPCSADRRRSRRCPPRAGPRSTPAGGAPGPPPRPRDRRAARRRGRPGSRP